MIPFDRQIQYNSVAGGACSSLIIEQRACSQPPHPCRSARQPSRGHVTEPPLTGGERPAPAGQLTAPLVLVIFGTASVPVMLCALLLLLVMTAQAAERTETTEIYILPDFLRLQGPGTEASKPSLDCVQKCAHLDKPSWYRCVRAC